METRSRPPESFWPRRYPPSKPGALQGRVLDSAENFTIAGVAPETYRMFAWDAVMEGAWTNQEFMVQYEPVGRILAVVGNANIEIELNVISARLVDR